MDQERDERIMRLVHSCSDMTVDERERYLSEECASDGELRAEVESLIDEDTAKTGSYAAARGLDKKLPDHYKLLHILGSGGMAEVFLAEDTRLGRRVAVKFLHDNLRSDEDLLGRFNIEARAASSLTHPNIITIYDIGESDGVRYIVSEYVEGESLGAKLARGPLSVRECIDLGKQIASALSAAHKAGVIHRDLKPDNIMLRPDGSVKVVDFGLAKASGPAIGGASGREAQTLQHVTTSPGIILGTPGYMSPEQCRGTPLDGRTDIFSLGVILFEMLTGHLPFGGPSAVDIIAAIVSQPPRPIERYLPDAPAGIVQLIDRALKKDADERYQTMDSLLEDLEREDLAIRGLSLTNGHAMSPAVAAATQRRPRYVLYTAAGAVIAALVLGGGWYLNGLRSSVGLTPNSVRAVPIESWNTASAENMNAAAFSPDTRFVAFASKQTGASEIWSKQVSGGGNRAAVTQNGFYNDNPVWSPDGQEIAYVSKRSGNRGIWRAAFLGGAEKQVADGVSGNARLIRWGNDQMIYFQEGAELFSVDASGGEKKKLTDFASMGLKPQRVTVQPDGSKLAVLVEEGNSWKIKVGPLGLSSVKELTDVATSSQPIDDNIAFANGVVFYSTAVDGVVQVFQAVTGQSSPVQLTRGSNDVYVKDASADAKKVLYTSVGETADVWAVSTEDGVENFVANDVAEEYWPDVSPDGKTVAYQSVGQPDKPTRGAILTKPVSGGTPVQIAGEGSCPVWSNDGQWIAFLRRTDGAMGLWKVRPSGVDPTKLAASAGQPGYVTTPYLKFGTHQISWSPDSAFVAFSSMSDGRSNIHVVSADGTGERSITANENNTEFYCCAAWTAGGRDLVFASSGKKNSYRLWIAPADGGPPRSLLEWKENFRFLGLSNDASEAVIVRQTDPADVASVVSVEVYLVSLQTGEARKVTTLADAYFHNFHLSADGHSIAYVTRSENRTDLWTFPVNGGTPKKLVSDKDPKNMFSSLAWSPDGRSVVFGKQTRTNQITMLTN